MTSVRLYDYIKSSAAYRVRIALNLKNLDYEKITVDLLKNGGEQRDTAYLSVNPQGLVPTLQENGLSLGQSLAILQWLDDRFPRPALLPRHPAEAARVRQIAFAIACDIHPLNNLRVLNYLTDKLGVTDDARQKWYHHWINVGFEAVETLLVQSPLTGTYCHGDRVSQADICLVPQVFNARRFDVPLDSFPTIVRIDAACQELEAFKMAAPK